MRVLSRKKLRTFARQHPQSEFQLGVWWTAARSATWTNLVEVQKTFKTAESVGNFTVFNICGNKYRLIVHIRYDWGKIFIRHVLTHAEYDKEKWKNDPYCR